MANLSRLLYVEDNADSVELVRFMLGGEIDFYEIISTDSANDALVLHRAERFDLYILDYRLPEMSGIELCRRIRQTDKTTPILFFTAMARPADRSVAIAAGANDFLVKPDDLFRLSGVVKSLLNLNKPVRKFSPPSRVVSDSLW